MIDYHIEINKEINFLAPLILYKTVICSSSYSFVLSFVIWDMKSM